MKAGTFTGKTRTYSHSTMFPSDCMDSFTCPCSEYKFVVRPLPWLEYGDQLSISRYRPVAETPSLGCVSPSEYSLSPGILTMVDGGGYGMSCSHMRSPYWFLTLPSTHLLVSIVLS